LLKRRRLNLSSKLYSKLGLTRAYYSGFSPVAQTPFENLSPTNPLREHRLYQASFLLRDYGWRVEDLAFMTNGNLPTDLDPKRAWAEAHLRQAPIEVMTANQAQLLRIPGIGPKAADAIMQARRRGRLTELAHLQKLGVRAPEQSAPYILLGGRSPLMQIELF
jgi:predicted DNA-binding helix-hairpin-helix protein